MSKTRDVEIHFMNLPFLVSVCPQSSAFFLLCLYPTSSTVNASASLRAGLEQKKKKPEKEKKMERVTTTDDSKSEASEGTPLKKRRKRRSQQEMLLEATAKIGKGGSWQAPVVLPRSSTSPSRSPQPSPRLISKFLNFFCLPYLWTLMQELQWKSRRLCSTKSRKCS